ncbi:retrovirus-related Pol polyprotein from transposon 412 [Trichonephila clavipes]|nr:retrovirus-related Pol polyprotein from transposon 412 [Trichonephila clavipes]
MEQQIADLLRQNQDLIRALQIREDSHSHKVTVQFEKFDEENENFDSFIERFETYLDVQNVPIANRAKVFVSSLSAKLYQLLKNLLAPDIPSDQTKISKKPIKPTNIVFKKTYKGDSIIPLGYVTVRVQYKNQKVNLNLYIVKENLDTILGREWLYKIHLDWPAIIKAFRAKTEQNLNNLLREYKDIFDDKLGEINNYEAKLKLRHGVKPIFCRVRTVPFALKGRVENEIDRLEKEGIIEKVDSSEWATPVVPVVKSDGSIRLCADYSVTLNPNLIVPQHPLPRLDEIFW